MKHSSQLGRGKGDSAPVIGNFVYSLSFFREFIVKPLSKGTIGKETKAI